MCQVMADVWMGSDLKAHMAAWPCALLEHDDDYGAALLPSNPHHQAREGGAPPLRRSCPARCEGLPGVATQPAGHTCSARSEI